MIDKVVNVRKFEYIDFLRGLAIVGVIGTHCYLGIDGLSTVVAYLFNYGNLGVPLFFIASAFTLCLSATQRKESSPFDFYIRRFFRIAPLYYFGIVFYFAWRVVLQRYKTGLISFPDGYSIIGVLENIFFLHGFDPVYFTFVVPGGWSIATEMAFYVLFPFLFYLLNKIGVLKFSLFAFFIVCISLFLQLFLVFLVVPGAKPGSLISLIGKNDEFGYLYASILNQINIFLVGMVAFCFLGTRIKKWHLFIAWALCVISAFILNNHSFDTGVDGFFYPWLSAIAFSIFTLRLANCGTPNSLFFLWMARIGRRSFSMYIMHFFVLDILRFVLLKLGFARVVFAELHLAVLFFAGIAISYVAAGFTEKFIEKPGIAFGRRLIGA